MEPTSKAFKLYGETDTRIYHVDRISNLPPDLIGNILSLLPTTKEAVATSVLSTKWKWSWTFITRLNFVECSSVDAHGEDQIELLKESFISFVYGVLFYRKPTPLNYFGIRCHLRHYASHVRAWVSAALSVGVKELDLSIFLKDDATHVLPSELFSCKSLVKLKLSWGFRMYVPPMVSLPSLDVLTLNNVGFHDDDSLRRLLIGCPSLEEFENNCSLYIPCVLPLELFSFRNLAKLILDCGFVMNPPTLVSLPSLEVLHLLSVKILDSDSLKRSLLGCPSLRELNIRTHDVDATVLHNDVPMLSDLEISVWSHSVLHSKLVLDTPSLRYLKVNGIASESLEVTDLNHLVEADICFLHRGTQFQVANDLIMAIPKVQTLFLSGSILEDITKLGCKLPKFENMTTLKLGVSNKAGWALLPDLLENAPVLETLVFQEGLKGSSYAENPTPTPTWYAPEKVPYCLTHHLKVIQVNHFEGDVEEEEMIKYFIVNRGAKDLTIQHSCGSKDFCNADVAEW